MTNPDDVSRVIMLLFGRLEAGGPFWCYVAIKPSRYEAFQAAQNEGLVDLYDFDEFGEVVVSAEGEHPPLKVTEEVARLYGTDARKFFREIDPLAEIAKQIANIDGESQENPPNNNQSSWTSRITDRKNS